MISVNIGNVSYEYEDGTTIYEIAKDFDASGDYQLAEYIMSLLSNANTFVPQVSENVSPFFEKIEANTDMLLLPDEITGDLIGIVNAIEHHIGINKFLFQGAPGTGKTEAVKQLARILNREIFMVDFSTIVDSKLGQTQKNLIDSPTISVKKCLQMERTELYLSS